MNNNEDLSLLEGARSQIHRHYFERAWCELKAKPTLENMKQVKYHAHFMDMSDSKLYTEVDDNGTFYVSYTDVFGTRVVSTMENPEGEEMTDFEFEDMMWHDVGDAGGSAETINAGNIQEVADKHRVEVFSIGPFDTEDLDKLRETIKNGETQDAVKVLTDLMNRILSMFTADGKVEVNKSNIAISTWEIADESEDITQDENLDEIFEGLLQRLAETESITVPAGEAVTVSGPNDTAPQVLPDMQQRVEADFSRIRAEVLKGSLTLDTILMPLFDSPFPALQERNIDAHLQD